MFKRIIILVDVILISVIFSSMQLFNNKNILDNSTIAEELFDKEEDIDNYLIGIYSNNTNFELITEQTYGNLSTLNVSQSALKEKYNDLTFMYYDLNGDGIINENDKIGDYGICQPTAVSIALRYMVSREMYTYFPKIENDRTDVFNIFYDVLGAYIDCGWNGGGAPQNTCYDKINTYFENIHNTDFIADFYTNDYLNRILETYDKQIPAIGHISGSDGGHAVVIAGVITKVVKYTRNVLWWEETEVKTFNYAVVNDGWYTVEESLYYPMDVYYKNYSYLDVSDLDGITIISEV